MKGTTTTNKKKSGDNPINVLLIGNNPMEMGAVYEKLKSYKSKQFITEISFNVKDALLKVFQFKPHWILVDDNLENKSIQRFTNNINQDQRTSHIPITLLKSSNYKQILSTGIGDFLLKDNFSAEKLYRSISNVMNFRRTQLYLYKSYKMGKRKVSKLVNF